MKRNIFLMLFVAGLLTGCGGCLQKELPYVEYQKYIGGDYLDHWYENLEKADFSTFNSKIISVVNRDYAFEFPDHQLSLYRVFKTKDSKYAFLQFFNRKDVRNGMIYVYDYGMKKCIGKFPVTYTKNHKEDKEE